GLGSLMNHKTLPIIDSMLNVRNITFFLLRANARLRGWQRITPNSNTTTITTAAQWDWKRHALTVPLEAFVS
ncbi:hypothetical protein XV86_17735, partial [Vibrio cholerae]